VVDYNKDNERYYYNAMARTTKMGSMQLDGYFDILDHYNAFIAYANIVDKTVRLFNQLNIKDSLEASMMYSYLLWNGIFSKNNKYQYDETINYSKKYNLHLNDAFCFGQNGMSIMTGKGVCLNNVSFLDDILKTTEAKTRFMVGNLIDGEMYYQPDVKRKLKFKKKTHKNNKKLHICELIEFSGDHLLYDPTNLIVFKINSDFNNQALNGTVKFNSLLFMEQNTHFSLEKITKIGNLYQTKMSQFEAELLTKEVFLKTLKKYHSQESKIIKFADDIKTDVNVVNTELKRYPTFDEIMRGIYTLVEGNFLARQTTVKEKVKK